MKRLLLVLIVLGTSSCSFFAECSEQNLADVKSPDGKYVASLFARNCGATTSYLFHVNLRADSDKFSPDLSGNIKEGEIFGIDGYKVLMEWTSPTTLVINCTECPADQPVNLERTWKDINILYRPGR